MLNRNDIPEFMTTRSAARRAGVGLRQINRAIASGELPVYAVGGWDRVRWSEVIAWIETTKKVVAAHSLGSSEPPP